MLVSIFRCVHVFASSLYSRYFSVDTIFSFIVRRTVNKECWYDSMRIYRTDRRRDWSGGF